MDTQSLGNDREGNPVFLKDIWPSNVEVAAEVAKVNDSMFRKEYAEVFMGDEQWQNIPVGASTTYDWDENSTYIQHPPFFQNLKPVPDAIKSVNNAFILGLFGDSITTDHISPAGSIKASSPAGLYLKAKGVNEEDFNSYGSRRGNHEVMMRGTFANIRLQNEMVPLVSGGQTILLSTNEQMSIYDAAQVYMKNETDSE